VKLITRNQIEKSLHQGAGCVLLIFAFFHVFYLIADENVLIQKNIVFPFVTNEALIISVTIFEFLVAIICFKYAAHNATNVAILLFVGVIIWYRWAFYFTGGRDCNCTGMLGRVLHLNKNTENAIPIVALVFLFASTWLWLYKLVFGKLAGKIRMMIIGLAIVSCIPLHAQQNIEIQGIYTIEGINRALHAPIKESQRQVYFIATLSDNNWSINVQGVGPNGSNTWETLTYDGTNTYYTCPFADVFANSPSETNEFFTSIMPGESFDVEVISSLDIYFPWMVFGLSSQAVEKAKDHSMPLPWRQPRGNPLNFGYKWDVTASDDNHFIKDCTIVRDQSLDLDDEKELLRPGIDYPSSLAEKLSLIKRIQIRRDIPSGFIAAHYICNSWIITNQMSIPSTATIYRYEYSPSHEYAISPAYQATLEVTNITMRPFSALLQAPMAVTRVYDYRYRTNNISRIFSSADYLLQSNDAWKGPNDKVLLQKASDWLKHGRKYDDLSKEKNYFAWIILIFMFAPILIYIVLKVKNNKKPSKKTKI
jgi:hypothetical protein